jgi:hypothetical protein
MSDTARDFITQLAANTEGLEDLFDAEVAEDLAVAGPWVADGQPEGHVVTLSEAAEMLGITRRSALRLVQEAKVDGAKDGHGQWLVKTASIQNRMRAKNLNASHVQHVAVEVDEGHGRGWPGGQSEGQLEIMKDLLCKVEALTYRNGYLESQLAERISDVEQQREQIKLLTDSQHKTGLWTRFCCWLVGKQNG